MGRNQEAGPQLGFEYDEQVDQSKEKLQRINPSTPTEPRPARELNIDPFGRKPDMRYQGSPDSFEEREEARRKAG